MASPLLLTYNLNPLAGAGLAALCKRQGIRLRPVQPGEYALPIGALAGIPVSAATGAVPPSPFADEMLVMCHMLSDQLDAFLQGMRDLGIARIPLKAVLTPSNVAWTSSRLHDELSREHEAMVRRARQ